MNRDNVRSFEEARERVGDAAGRARDAVRGGVDEAMDQLRGGYEHLHEGIDGSLGDLASSIRKNPGTAVVLSALVGLGLGLLFRARSED